MNTTLTELEKLILTKKYSKSQRQQIKSIVEANPNEYSKSLIKDHVKSFIKDLASKYDEDTEIEIKMSIINILFYEWKARNSIDCGIDTGNLGLVIYNLKIDGITKGKRSTSGNSKKFNFKQIKDYFN
jgi:hypothetical protein